MEDICRVKDCLSKRSLMKRWRLHQTLIGSCRNIRYTNNVKSECVLNSLLRQYIVLWSSQIIWFCYKSQSIKSSIEYFKGQKKKYLLLFQASYILIGGLVLGNMFLKHISSWKDYDTHGFHVLPCWFFKRLESEDCCPCS